MFDFLGRLFGKDEGSKKAAKDRLRLVLVHDRTNLSPHIMESLKEDLISVISKYLEIDEEGLDVSFDQEEETTALIANIPIRQVRRGVEIKANS